METVGIGEKRKLWDTGLLYDGSVYGASNWKRGVYSFPSGTTGSMGTPFTCAQWLELQRQAMIYKYINASIPECKGPYTEFISPGVPQILKLSSNGEVLIKIHVRKSEKKTERWCSLDDNFRFWNTPGGAGSLVNHGFLANRTDPEPRRCRRTDGKKWRCSKDAAPDKKYCERHMHRGKPRSRKPVEVLNNKATDSTTTTAIPTNAISVASPVVRGVGNLSWNYVGCPDSYGLFGNQEDKSSSQLKHAESKTRITEAKPYDDTCKQQHQTSFNLDYANIKDYSFSIPNSDLGSVNEQPASMKDQSIKTRGFIDAWSTEKATTLTSINNLASPDLPHSGLSLSMQSDQSDLTISDSLSSMQSTISENIILQKGHCNSVSSKKQVQVIVEVTWANHDSSRCGPLGEFFQPHQRQNIDITEKPHTPEMLFNLWRDGYSDSNEISPEVSPRRPLVSSPTGVLQKTLI